MNETIKTYTQITPLDGLKLLVENDGKQVDGFAFWNVCNEEWQHSKLAGCNPTNSSSAFTSRWGWTYSKCAKVTEIDPCNAPDGCPELEPWMAYVGLLSDQTRTGIPLHYPFHSNEPLSDDWDTMCRGGCNDAWPCCIDVRTEWAQEHFPEHCRIRNYQEPDAFDVAWKSEHRLQQSIPESICRYYYELGQANAK